VVKVLDFGLAKLTEKTSGQSVGRSDSEVNTELLLSAPGRDRDGHHYLHVAEQAQGSHIDERTDLWSTGVIIYEMVAGLRSLRWGNEQPYDVNILEKRSPHRSQKWACGTCP